MQFLLINKIKVQNANAIAGFTWGFPGITHFLGFTHNLERKLGRKENFSDIGLNGCGVISHDQHTHTFGKYDKSFTQHRYQPYLEGSNKKSSSPAIIEEGKMNMTVSIIIEIEGNIGNRAEDFIKFIESCCHVQNLAGGTIFEIGEIELSSDINKIKRKLLPGFVLMDRSEYLESYSESLKKEDDDPDFLKAWLDFSALKQSARPKHDLIVKYLDKQEDSLKECFAEHIAAKPYKKETIPKGLKQHFENIEESKLNKKLLEQWKHYCEPTEKSSADWEYLPKPFSGFLVPIMIGYKAISKVYENSEVANTRDSETPICFVESAHSVGEWISPYRIQDLSSILWSYYHKEHWYLCKQQKNTNEKSTEKSDEYSDYL